MKPIRCYTCGKVLGNKWEYIDRELENGVSLKDVYEKIKVTRYCCKRVILGAVDDTINTVGKVPDNIKMIRENKSTVFLKIV